MGNQQQQSLARRRASPAACRAGASGSDRFTSFVLNITLWRLLSLAGLPLRQIVSWYVFTGRSCWALVVDVQRWLWRAVGWLSAPPRSAALQRFGSPLLDVRRWHYGLASLALAVLAAAASKRIRDATDEVAAKQRALRRALRNAGSYQEFAFAAEKLEALKRRTPPAAAAAAAKERRLYDAQLLRDRMRHLKAVRASGDLHKMMDAVRSDLIRNLANMTNRSLHEASPIMPQLIREYIAEMKLHLEYLTRQPELPLGEKLDFLRETRHCYGRTALVLSGGGALGVFHLGVVKALFDNGLLPKVLSGSSVGSIISAIIATRNDEELAALFQDMADVDLSFFSNSTFGQYVRHMLLKGTLQDHTVLQKRLRIVLEDVTFADAYNKSGRILNIAVCAADTNEPPRLLNYLTAPNVVVWSAVACSSAFPGLFQPQDLLAKDHNGNFVRFTAEEGGGGKARRWRDGSLEEDLPMRGLAEMFNVNYFICSQTNPHIIPALNIKRHLNRTFADMLEQEFKHRCRQLHMLLPNWLPGFWLKVISQPWEGDITMVLPSMVWQIKKAISNPSKQELYQSLKQGEAVTWQKLSAIQAACDVELTFDRCLAMVKAAEAQERTESSGSGHLPRRGNMRSRIPSWSCMATAASMPRAASTDSLGGEVEAASARTADAAGMAVHDPPADGSSGALRAVESSTPPLHQADSSGLQYDGKPPAYLDGRNGFGGVHAGFGHGSHLSRSSAFATGVPRATSLDRLDQGCHWTGSAPDLTKALRMPAEAYPPLPFDCCDSSAAIDDIWQPAPPALGAGRPSTADAHSGIDYYAW